MRRASNNATALPTFIILFVTFALTGSCFAQSDLQLNANPIVIKRVVLKNAKATEIVRWLRLTLSSPHAQQADLEAVPADNSIKFALQESEVTHFTKLLSALDQVNTPVGKVRDDKGELLVETRLFIPVQESVEDVMAMLEKMPEVVDSAKLTLGLACIVGRGKPQDLDRVHKLLRERKVELMETRVWRCRKASKLKTLMAQANAAGLRVVSHGTEHQPQSTSHKFVMIARGESMTFEAFAPKVTGGWFVKGSLRFQLLAGELTPLPSLPVTQPSLPPATAATDPFSSYPLQTTAASDPFDAPQDPRDVVEHRMIKVRHADPTEIVKMLRDLMDLHTGIAKAGNTIILRGVKEQVIAEIEELISQLEMDALKRRQKEEIMIRKVSEDQSKLQDLRMKLGEEHPEVQKAKRSLGASLTELAAVAPHSSALRASTESMFGRPPSAGSAYRRTPAPTRQSYQEQTSQTTFNNTKSNAQGLTVNDLSIENSEMAGRKLRCSALAELADKATEALLEVKASGTASAEELKAQENKLTAAVELALHAQLKLQSAQLDAAQKELDKARQQLNEHKKNVSEIVKRRVELLANSPDR